MPPKTKMTAEEVAADREKNSKTTIHGEPRPATIREVENYRTMIKWKYTHGKL